MQFAADHVVQLLVIDDADENVGVDAAAGLPVVERLAASVLEAEAGKFTAQILLLLAREGTTIDEAASHGAQLAAHHLQYVGDSHAARNRVWVDDKIWDDTGGGEGHPLRRHHVADDSLLPVPAGELVAQLRDALVAHADTCDARAALGLGEHHRIDRPLLAVAYCQR